MKVLIVLSILFISNAFAAGTIQWKAQYPVAIVESVGIYNNGKNIIVGSGYNYDPSATLQLYNTLGSGNSLWSTSQPDLAVAGARSADVIAGMSWSQTAQQIRISMWRSNSSVPVWSYAVSGSAYMPDGQYPILVSDDGKTIVAGVTKKTGSIYNGAIYWFTNVQTSNPTVNFYNLAPNTGVRDLQISSDGTIAAVVATANIVVLDLTTKTVKLNQDFQFSTTALCMSPDGVYLGYGFQTLDILKYDGSKYNLINTLSSSVYLFGGCAISSNYLMGAGWTHYNYLQKRASLYNLKLSSPLVADYVFPPDSGQYQDDPTSIAISRNGEAFVLGAWGDGQSASTIAVFDTSSMTNGPVYSLSTVGSINDVDIFVNNNVAYVVGGGKSVHNNVMGDGGNVYSITVPVS